MNTQTTPPHTSSTPRVKSSPPVTYLVTPEPASTDPYDLPIGGQEEIIARALAILADRVREKDTMTTPASVKHFLMLRAAKHNDNGQEVFSVMFLDAMNRMIAFEEMFYGTLTQTSVYPREVVKRALAHHAASLILSHNHPSGSTEPSRADEHLTTALKTALATIDVRVLDHIVTTNTAAVSFAERGLI